MTEYGTTSDMMVVGFAFLMTTTAVYVWVKVFSSVFFRRRQKHKLKTFRTVTKEDKKNETRTKSIAEKPRERQPKQSQG